MSSRYRWVILTISVLTMTMVVGVRSSFPLFFQSLSLEFGWSRSSLSLLVAIHILVYGFSQPVVGRLVDGMGPRTIISFGVLLLAVGAWSMGHSSQLWQLYLGYALAMGMGYAMCASTANTLLVTRWFKQQQGLALSISCAGFPLGQLIGNPLVVALILLLGWRAAASGMGLVLLLALSPLVILLLRNQPPGDQSLASTQRSGQTVTWRTAWANPTYRLLLITNMINGFGGIMLVTHLPSLVLDAGWPPATVAMVMGAAAAANIGGTLLAGPASDRWGGRLVMVVMFCLRVLTLLFLAWARSVPALLVVALLFGVTFFAITPVNGLMITRLFGGKMGMVYGMLILSFQLGGALGSYLPGLIFDLLGDYFWAILLGAALSGLMIARWLVETEQPRSITGREGRICG